MGDAVGAGDPGPDLRAFELLPDGIWIFDDDGVTTYANRRMAQMLGRRQEEMPGTRFVDFFDAAGSPIFWEWFGEMLRTDQGRENFEAYFFRPDGSTVWGLLSSAPIHDATGRRTGWLHRVAPYTERKLLVDSLLASEQQLAQAQRVARLGSWQRDVDTDEMTWSDEMYRLLGMAPLEVPSTLETLLSLVHPDDRDQVVQEGRAATAQGNEYSYEVRILRRLGFTDPYTVE